MSRSKKKTKSPGYEYWSKRPVSRKCGAVPGKFSKKRTRRLERIEGKDQVKKERDDEVE